MRLLVYTVLRLLLVLAAAGVLYLIGMRSWLLWVTAVVVGALISYLVLRPQGRAAAEVIAELSPLREDRPTFSAAAEDDAAYEDALVDDALVDDAGSAVAGPATTTSATAAGRRLESQADPEQHAVAELEEPGVAQDHDQVPPGRTREHDPRDAERPRGEQQHEQSPR
ncbi:DUF4229 domain-containing protein [Georgenia yuyongxinii]|uniref:DUF4229 domain-containing protein n=1 Tax=Georgenia yuyongxinii TaxID=2589797 RepID=A0A552WPB3_9MICO|nr:DUF4229 domain-containing protein [Georgenia yuyongxinii]TRW44768.1 DUF4229 domain-containing protein [Georgenia yuyongxinii]